MPSWVSERVQDPTVIRRFNGWMTVFWACWFIPAIAIGSLRQSVFLVALYSIYANLVSHYTAWIASRAEVQADEARVAADHADVHAGQVDVAVESADA